MIKKFRQAIWPIIEPTVDPLLQPIIQAVDRASDRSFEVMEAYFERHPKQREAIDSGLCVVFKTTDNVIIGGMKLFAHQIFENSEAACMKLFLAHGHKVDVVEWEFNTCQMRCNRCKVRLFFNITIAGGSSAFEVYFGKGVETLGLGMASIDDKTKILSRRYNPYLCDKVSSLM